MPFNLCERHKWYPDLCGLLKKHTYLDLKHIWQTLKEDLRLSVGFFDLEQHEINYSNNLKHPENVLTINKNTLNINDNHKLSFIATRINLVLVLCQVYYYFDQFYLQLLLSFGNFFFFVHFKSCSFTNKHKSIEYRLFSEVWNVLALFLKLHFSLIIYSQLSFNYLIIVLSSSCFHQGKNFVDEHFSS